MDIKRRPIWQYVLLVLGCLCFYVLPFGLLFGLSFIEDDTKFETLKSGEVSINNKKLVIEKDVKSKYRFTDNTLYIYGYIKNNSKEDIENLSLDYELYDKDGTILGVATAYLDNLPKGKTWKFKATYSDMDAKDVKKYNLISVVYGC